MTVEQKSYKIEIAPNVELGLMELTRDEKCAFEHKIEQIIKSLNWPFFTSKQIMLLKDKIDLATYIRMVTPHQMCNVLKGVSMGTWDIIAGAVKYHLDSKKLAFNPQSPSLFVSNKQDKDKERVLCGLLLKEEIEVSESVLVEIGATKRSTTIGGIPGQYVYSLSRSGVEYCTFSKDFHIYSDRELKVFGIEFHNENTDRELFNKSSWKYSDINNGERI